MSYNQAYEQDSGENVSYNNSYRLDVDRRNTLLPVIKGSQIVTTPPPPPVIDPNLLFDVNFDSSLDVDYTKDGNPLVFEPNNPTNVTEDDGFVTINPVAYIKLTQGLPSYLKHTGDQSWIVNFRAESTAATRFVVHTTPPEGTREDTFLIRTGIFIFLYSTFFQVTLFKGVGETLVNIQEPIGHLDNGVNMQSAVFTYRRADHKLIIYYNGVFIKEITAPAGNEANVIDWSTADNLYVNRSHRFIPNSPTHYEKISAYDKILTLEEIVDIYNASQL